MSLLRIADFAKNSGLTSDVFFDSDFIIVDCAISITSGLWKVFKDRPRTTDFDMKQSWIGRTPSTQSCCLQQPHVQVNWLYLVLPERLLLMATHVPGGWGYSLI